MSSVLSPQPSVAPPSRGMLTKQKNIVSEQIKKCTINPIDFNENDIKLLKEMKNILDDSTIDEIEKKQKIKLFIDNHQLLLFTPRPSLKGKTIIHILAIGSIKTSISWFTSNLLKLASSTYPEIHPDNLDTLIQKCISILDNNIINKKDPSINCMDNDNKTPLYYACENSKTNPNPIMKNILEYDNFCSTIGGGKKTQRKTQRKNKKQKKSV